MGTPVLIRIRLLMSFHERLLCFVTYSENPLQNSFLVHKGIKSKSIIMTKRTSLAIFLVFLCLIPKKLKILLMRNCVDSWFAGRLRTAGIEWTSLNAPAGRSRWKLLCLIPPWGILAPNLWMKSDPMEKATQAGENAGWIGSCS